MQLTCRRCHSDMVHAHIVFFTSMCLNPCTLMLKWCTHWQWHLETYAIHDNSQAVVNIALLHTGLSTFAN